MLCAGFSDRPPREPALILWQVESYARIVALSLHQAGFVDEIVRRAHVDGLTGCLDYVGIRSRA